MAAVVQASSSLALLPTQRKLNLTLLAEAGVEEPERWLAEASEAVVAALERRGEATAVELGGEVPGLRQQVVGAAGTKWAATQGMAGRVLLQLGIEGRVVRGRPRGSWRSSQYRWATMAGWLGEQGMLTPAFELAFAAIPLPTAMLASYLFLRDWRDAISRG